jgi:hypothetical protein
VHAQDEVLSPTFRFHRGISFLLLGVRRAIQGDIAWTKKRSGSCKE